MTLAVVRFTTSPEGAENPLPTIPRVARFREQVAERALTDPAPQQVRMLDHYRVLG